jgi:deoxyribodipyrimidine photolyase
MTYALLKVIPNPVGLRFEDWASTVVGYNAGLHNQLSPEMDWRDFAQRLSLAYPATPRSEPFETWQEWADALRITLQL